MYIILYVHQPSSHMLWDMVNEMKLKSVLLPFSLPYLVLTFYFSVCVCDHQSVCVCDHQCVCVRQTFGVYVLWTGKGAE